MPNSFQLPVRRVFERLAPIGPTPAGVSAAERLGCEFAMIQACNGRASQVDERLRGEFGLALPVGPRRVSSRALALLGLGPLRWLAISSGEMRLAEALERTLAGCAAVIDQTDGLALLRIGGPRARETFAKGLPIDLDPQEFAADHVAVSAVAHVGLTIWRLDDAPTFEVAVPRSYANAFAHWLQQSAAEFGLAVG